MSQVRQNYHKDSEKTVNEHVNALLHASYTYMSIAYHFDRDDQGLPNLFKFFIKLSENRNELAEKLLKYQNSRGGRVVLQPVKKPAKDVWGSGADALQTALDMEKSLNQAAILLHDVTDRTNDAALSDYVEEQLLEVYVDEIKKLGNHVTAAKLAGPNLGEYLFEREFEPEHMPS